MESVFPILSDLRDHRIRISLDDKKIKLSGENKQIPEWLIQKIKDNKEQLVSFLEKEKKDGSKQNQNIIATDQKKVVETTFYQQREWILYKIKPDKNFFNTQSFFQLLDFDRNFLENIIRIVAERHPNLRCTFNLIDGEIRQVVHPMTLFSAPIEIVSLANEAQLKEAIEAENIKPFDFENEFLYRIKCFSLPDTPILVLFTAHHVIVDNVSMKILQDEIKKIYNHYVENLPLNLPSIKKQTYDFSILQNSLAKSDSYFGKYWKNKLSGGIPYLDLVSEKNRQSNQSHRKKLYQFIKNEIENLKINHPPSIFTLISRFEAHNGGELKGIFFEKTFQTLNILSTQLKTSIYHILISTYALTIFQLTNQKEFFIEIPLRCQTQGYENTLGWLPLSGFFKVEINERLSIQEFIIETAQKILEMIDSSIFPAEALFNTELKVEQCLPSLVSYVENNRPIESDKILGSQHSRHDGLIAYSDIFCTFGKYEDALEYVVYYSRNLYQPDQIQQLFDKLSENINQLPILLESLIMAQSPKLTLS